jgi:hypothetical protein
VTWQSTGGTEKRAIVQSIRTYYPDDKRLLECANFIEYWTEKGMKITQNSRYYTFGFWQDAILSAAAISAAAVALEIIAALSVVVYRKLH